MQKPHPWGKYFQNFKELTTKNESEILESSIAVRRKPIFVEFNGLTTLHTATI